MAMSSIGRVQLIMPFFLLLAISSILFITRLVDIQVVRGESFERQADANRFFNVRLPAERGVLLDRFGQPLVYNVPAYGLIEDPQARYTSTTPLTQEQALEAMAKGDQFVEYSLQRSYLYPESLAHILGYTGSVSAADLLADRRLHITDSIGKHGLERLLENRLRGQSSLQLFEVDAFGRRQRLVHQEEGKAGESIKTTIDPYLSEVAYKAMGDQRGAVVIMDADNGEIIALVSTPTFNNSMLSSRHIDPDLERQRQQDVRSFFSNPQQLFFNRAMSGSYPPGSVFKPITALAALDSGAIDRQTIVRDEGKLEVGDFSFANWYYLTYGVGEGDLALERAMARSNDIYFYKAAEWTGPTKLAEMARLFGYGKKTGVELGSEADGLVPDPAWKERVIGERWFLGNTYHFGIGQGDLQVSPLQVASMTQAIANDGAKCQPTLLYPLSLTNGRLADVTCSELGLKKAHLDLVFSSLLDACSPGGTASIFFARNQQARQSGLSLSEQLDRGAVACKTGTAELGSTDAKGRKKTHGWFTAILRVDPLRLENSAEVGSGSPESEQHLRWLNQVRQHGYPQTLAVAVLVESDEVQPYKEGSREAAPVVKAVLDWMEQGLLVEPVTTSAN
jgi:penicillin-binding protein 2